VSGGRAQSGVLIRDAEALERMEKVDTVVVDKTGTLTEGKPQVTRLVPAEAFSEEELMRLAGGLEKAVSIRWPTPFSTKPRSWT